eukprot:NODE_2918_length_1460_cov_33.240090_g2525_i0.p1 GENE.NODE_2918_length_1460_cov_33.240090_g2525_i0~~NODE_2918_length_1460_cov_33.240090_g2525_i0.p1  ORF type:complete len:226 (-),score=35.76 NODE_2918_length_1460_cov_33.240090_g2525_i0:688-1365(-)
MGCVTSSQVSVPTNKPIKAVVSESNDHNIPTVAVEAPSVSSPTPPAQKSHSKNNFPRVAPLTGLTLDKAEEEANVMVKQTIDIKMAMDQVSGDLDLLKELNGILHQQYQTEFPKVLECLNTCNWLQLWKTVHSLKGGAMNLGIDRFAACCHHLEVYVKQLQVNADGGTEVTADQKERIDLYIQLTEKHWNSYMKAYEGLGNLLSEADLSTTLISTFNDVKIFNIG